VSQPSAASPANRRASTSTVGSGEASDDDEDEADSGPIDPNKVPTTNEWDDDDWS